VIYFDNLFIIKKFAVLNELPHLFGLQKGEDRSIVHLGLKVYQ
jgi:hypothetical protein